MFRIYSAMILFWKSLLKPCPQSNILWIRGFSYSLFPKKKQKKQLCLAGYEKLQQQLWMLQDSSYNIMAEKV